MTALDPTPGPDTYPDDGCDVSPSCFTCPLEFCKYDDPTAYHREKLLADYRGMEVSVQERGIQAAAIDMGVSERTIHRAMLELKMGR